MAGFFVRHFSVDFAGIATVELIVSPSRFTFTAPKRGQLLTNYTYTHVAGCIGPDTAVKGAAARVQSHRPQRNECGLPMCAVAELEPRTECRVNTNEPSALDRSVTRQSSQLFFFPSQRCLGFGTPQRRAT